MFDVTDQSHIPWYLPLLVDEVLHAEADPVALRRRIRQLLPELKDQAEAYWHTANHFSNLSDRTNLDVHLHGGLDLFADTCPSLMCRMAASNRLARSVGIFADHVWLSDTLTVRLLEFGRATNEKVASLINDALVIANIFPLIEAGVIKFRPPELTGCPECLNEIEMEISKSIDSLVPHFVDTQEISLSSSGRAFVQTTGWTEPPKVYPLTGSTEISAMRETLRAVLYEEIYSTALASLNIRLLGGTLFSSSKVGLAGLSLLRGIGTDGRASVRAPLREDVNLVLPWISDLSPSQIVELRAEAATALPEFRELMSTVFSGRHQGESEAASMDRIDALRERSARVDAELNRISRSSEAFWRTTFGVLGFGISACGLFAQNNAATVLGPLLPIIHNILSHQSGDVRKRAELMSEPAYVLIKAKDMLAHT